MTRESNSDDSREALSDSDSDLDALMRKVAYLSPELAGPPLPQPGEIVGEKYRIVSRLGRGGMGAVFHATHVVSQKPVAVKWMLRSASDERARTRFFREAHAAARIDHPNVVNVYDVGQEGHCCYLVMELLHGEPFRSRMETGPLSHAEVVDLLLPAMRGVSAVHKAGVIHRDLKPDNIFLCRGPDGVPREAKVLDFGISAVTGAAPGELTLTRDGGPLGTPAYMSPEQLQSARTSDASSDIYSFGVILYEALAGKLPFEADSFPGLVLAVVNDPPTPLRAHRPELPEALERVVMRALAKDPAERYATMDALVAAIAPYGSQREVAASEPARPAARVHSRLGVAVLGALAVIALMGALVSSWDERVGSSHVRAAPRAALPPPAAAPAVQPTAAAPLHQPTNPPLEATLAPGPPKPSAAPAAKTRPARHVANKRPGCDPPYAIDASGHKEFKLECM